MFMNGLAVSVNTVAYPTAILLYHTKLTTSTRKNTGSNRRKQPVFKLLDLQPP